MLQREKLDDRRSKAGRAHDTQVVSRKEEDTRVGNGGSEQLRPNGNRIIVPSDDQCRSGNLAQGDLPRAHRTRMSGKRLTVCSDSIGEGAERRGHRIRDGAGVMGLQSSDDSGSGDHSGIYSTLLYHSSANPTDHQAGNKQHAEEGVIPPSEFTPVVAVQRWILLIGVLLVGLALNGIGADPAWPTWSP